MKGRISNIRSKVEKREILQYILLRERILHESYKEEKDVNTRRIISGRRSEMNVLINAIKKDTIREEIKKMHKHIHINNDYETKTKEDKE